MNKRNSHQASYQGPARAIPTRTWRTKLADTLSATAEPIVYTIGLITVLMDIFIWRP